MADTPPRVIDLLKRLNRAAERLERATEQAIVRFERRRDDHERLARVNEELRMVRDGVAEDLAAVISRLRALLDGG